MKQLIFLNAQQLVSPYSSLQPNEENLLLIKHQMQKLRQRMLCEQKPTLQD